ncbi:aminopeptidase N [Nakamurella flava]|uniref:Aminopeptidase N n=1 Tax=Nakamurella flava TaxID=2576308 RepID=A0A4U6QQ56_9ACTN|nr:aminopeptidase N [Nakamurella flava]
MQTPNLTRDQATERSEIVRTDSYDIQLDVTDGAGGPGTKTFATRTTLRFGATAGASTFVDFVGDGIRSATLNGRALDVDGWTNVGGLALPDLADDNELVVDADGLYTNSGEGLHRFVDPVDGQTYLYTQFETADAKRMFACFDQPDLKARFTVTVTAPAGWHVVSNGAASGDPEDGPAGSQVHRFVTTEPMSTYITALVAGPYHVVRDSHDGIDLGLYCRATLAEFLDAERLFTETKQGFDFYHRNFGIRYPFGKYDQLFVPEFNAGAMENAGCVTYREEYVFRSRVTRYLYERRCETVLHEMAHMWFGDLVTMRWWDDLWLNESFATWASVLCQASATEYTSAWTTFASVEKSWAYVQDQLPSTHPISADMVDLRAVEVNFDGITYAKGASVLKQLAAYVGLEEFLSGLRHYFQAHQFGNATLADLLSALEETSGRDLGEWSRAWLTTTGINTISADFDTETGEDGAEVFSRFELVQHGAEPGAGELRPHRLAVGVYDTTEAGALKRIKRVELDVTTERTPVPDLVGTPRGRLVLVNDDDLTYCKARLDADSLSTVIEGIGTVGDSLARTLLWSAVWEMTRDGLMRARDFITLAARGMQNEDQSGVLERVYAQLQLSVGAYADPAWAAEEGWPQVRRALLDAALGAEPGSDTQLSAVQALAACSLSPDELDVIAGWRSGERPLPGLTVDTDLSWTLLGALVAHGRAGAGEIDEAAAADATASGERRAVQARALVPTAENKRAVWDQIFGEDTLANALVNAAMAGFAHPAQTELLLPYTEQYFEQVPALWEGRSSEIAKRVTTGLYPRWDVSERTAELARAFEAGDAQQPARRLVSEGRAGTERALRARAADAGSR